MQSKLSSLILDTYDQLARAAVDGKHDWHWPSLVVQNSSRIIVLRKLIRRPLSWEFHTDRRSEKVELLGQSQGACAALFYNRKKMFQVRATGVANLVEAGDYLRHTWENLPVRSKKSYATVQAPASPIATPDLALTASWKAGQPTQQELSFAFENFRIYRVSITQIDALQIGREGQHRALWQAGHEESATWVTP